MICWREVPAEKRLTSQWVEMHWEEGGLDGGTLNREMLHTKLVQTASALLESKTQLCI